MSVVNRENVLGTKLRLLEKRLDLLEHFVEIRFCESFRDFVMQRESSMGKGRRNAVETRLEQRKSFRQVAQKVIPGVQKEVVEDDNNGVPVRRTRSGRCSKRPARLFSGDRIESEQRREEDKILSGVSIQTYPDSEEERTKEDEADEYFTFPDDDERLGIHYQTADARSNSEFSEVEDNVQVTKTVIGENDDSSKSYESERQKGRKVKRTKTPRGKRVPYSTRKKDGSMSVIPGANLVLQSSIREQCSICLKYFRKELIGEHMEFHTKERHLKCSFCDKTFFNRSMVIKHEKLHQPEKYSKKCRLCDKTTIESGKMLVHERSCIRRALEQKRGVDPALMEEIRRRSPGMDLKWPDPSSNSNHVKEKKCNYCSKYFHFAEYSKHVKTHATWVCSLCNNSYVNKEGLAKHMRNVHGATYPPRARDSLVSVQLKVEAEDELGAVDNNSDIMSSQTTKDIVTHTVPTQHVDSN